MRKRALEAAVIVFLFLLAMVPLPSALAAPGDFVSLWGAQQHLTGALGVAVDASGNVYVTMPENVQVFNSAGIRIRKWGSYGSGDGQVSNPLGIGVDRNGRVYVADTGNGRVEVFDSTGRFVAKWTQPDWAVHPPAGVASDGTVIYVLADHMVTAFDSEGNVLRQFGGTGTGNGQLWQPTGIAADSSGNVYVLDVRDLATIQVFNAAGQFVKQMVTDFPWGASIAVGQSGNFYIAGGDSGDDHFIAVLDNSGTALRYLRPFLTLCFYRWEHYWDPRALAVDAAENIYALDVFDDGLNACDSMGTPLSQWWTFGCGLGQLSSPTWLAADGKGNIYETDGNNPVTAIVNDRVQVFTGTGTPIATWTATFCQTSGIAINASSNGYVLDVYDPFGQLCQPGSVAQVFDSAGNPLRKVGAVLPEQNFFGIAFDKSGNFLVTDSGNSNIRVYDVNGNLLRTFGSAGTGNGQFQNPQGIAIDASGNIFVVDSGNSRVQMFNSSYTYVRKWGAPGTGDGYFSTPSGITVDGSGHVFVADTGNNRIQAFDSAGAFLLKWGSSGDDNGQFREPRGVVVDPTGAKVYVADTGNNRIEVFSGYGSAGPFSMSGTVRQGSATGPVLAGATVSIAGKSATTSSTGAFSITGIPGGTYTLTISRTGYATKTVTGYAVNSNQTGLVFYLVPTYSMSGTVRQGSTTGAVLAGATVSIAGKTVTTSSTGTFTITGIPAGTYTLTISRTGFATKTVTGYAVNSNQTGLVFYLVRAYSISGTVRQGSTTGPVLAGATVSIAGKTTTTSSTGTFTITGIPSGSYTLTISKTGFVTRTITGYSVTSNRTGLVFYLLPAYTISGVVRQGSSTGPVLAGATVSVAGKSATTSSTGTFSISGIAAGTYTLTISKSGFVTKTITGYVISSNRSGLVFYLAPAYTISGVVRQGSSTGPVLPGATVSIAGKTVTTSSTGTFSITGIPSGSYTLTISKTGYVTKRYYSYAVTSNRSGLVFYLVRSS